MSLVWYQGKAAKSYRSGSKNHYIRGGPHLCDTVHSHNSNCQRLHLAKAVVRASSQTLVQTAKKGTSIKNLREHPPRAIQSLEVCSICKYPATVSLESSVQCVGNMLSDLQVAGKSIEPLKCSVARRSSRELHLGAPVVVAFLARRTDLT